MFPMVAVSSPVLVDISLCPSFGVVLSLYYPKERTVLIPISWNRCYDSGSPTALLRIRPIASATSTPAS